METYFKIACPKCKAVLIVDRITGEVIEIREPLLEHTTGDRFEDAVQKARTSTKEAEEKFQKSQAAQKNKQKDLDDLFRKSLEQVKKEGPVEKPIKSIDLE